MEQKIILINPPTPNNLQISSPKIPLSLTKKELDLTSKRISLYFLNKLTNSKVQVKFILKLYCSGGNIQEFFRKFKKKLALPLFSKLSHFLTSTIHVKKVLLSPLPKN